MGTTATTLTGAIAEHEEDINFISAWNHTSGNFSNLSQFTEFIDNIYTVRGSQGFHFGYIQAADATAIGLRSVGGYYFVSFSNSNNYRLVVVISTAGVTVSTLYKASGSWNNTWTSLHT